MEQNNENREEQNQPPLQPNEVRFNATAVDGTKSSISLNFTDPLEALQLLARVAQVYAALAGQDTPDGVLLNEGEALNAETNHQEED